MKEDEKKLYKNLPETPGVYVMKDDKGRILYIGKAGNLKRRVSSYFSKAHDNRIESLVSKIRKIEFKKTDSVLEALILEADLIKKHQPPFNVREKDDKSFLFFEIEESGDFPRVLLVRGKEPIRGKRFGPFVSASSARESLKILRKIFPWNDHFPKDVGTKKKPCFNFQIGLCPGTCIGAIEKKEYAKTIKNISLFFSGEKKKIVKNLEKEMKKESKNLNFEKAEKIKRQIFSLKHIEDTALLSEERSHGSEKRIEGYDISNISGKDAVGSMVVFADGKPEKNEYRKFKIKSGNTPDDTKMLQEVLERRFRHDEWDFPDLVLVDGGMGQKNRAEKVLKNLNIKISVLGIAKGPKRDKDEVLGKIPAWTDKKTLLHVRDEAHRFALVFHRKMRSGRFIKKI